MSLKYESSSDSQVLQLVIEACPDDAVTTLLNMVQVRFTLVCIQGT
jgi:hypothetical protein